MKYQGRAFIRGNGVEYPSADDATLDPGGFIRETVKGSEVYGYQETAKEASVECKLFNCSDTDVLVLQAMTDITVEYETDVGQTYLLANAWVVGDISLNGKGEIPLKFAAVKCVKV